jgi:hypothetical protein
LLDLRRLAVAQGVLEISIELDASDLGHEDLSRLPARSPG